MSHWTPTVGTMDIILIPGFWLGASSWAEVTPALEAAGHRVHSLTLPGLDSVDADRAGIRLRDHVEAVIAAVDGSGGPVVLVGHSGGGAIAYAAADGRPDQVARIVYVDSGPLGHGQSINAELPVVDGEIPLPDWSFFEEETVRDLDGSIRRAFRARAVPQPMRVASDPQVLSNDRRYDVPATVIACEFSERAVPPVDRGRDTRMWPSWPPSETSSTSTFRRDTGPSSPGRPSSHRPS